MILEGNVNTQIHGCRPLVVMLLLFTNTQPIVTTSWALQPGNSPAAPGHDVILCGSVTCDVTKEYCTDRITGIAECFLCTDVCAPERIGSNPQYIEHCRDVCPVFLRQQQLSDGISASHLEGNLKASAQGRQAVDKPDRSPLSPLDALLVGVLLMSAAVLAIILGIIITLSVEQKSKRGSKVSRRADAENSGALDPRPAVTKELIAVQLPATQIESDTDSVSLTAIECIAMVTDSVSQTPKESVAMATDSSRLTPGQYVVMVMDKASQMPGDAPYISAPSADSGLSLCFQSTPVLSD